MKMHKNKMTKDTVPEGLTVLMALTDLIPVIFFGLSAVKVGSLFRSPIFIVGAIICLISGIIKVLWKLIAAISKKNIWAMFVQMRILVPAGFLLMIFALLIGKESLNTAVILEGLIGFPSCIFFGVGTLGMILMVVFAFGMDSRNPKVNWLEQAVNGISQICFFIGLILI